MKLRISDDPKMSEKCKDIFGPHKFQNIAKMGGSCGIWMGDRSQKYQDERKSLKVYEEFCTSERGTGKQ